MRWQDNGSIGQFSIGHKFTGKEALDHWANLGTEGQRKCFDRSHYIGTWKVVKASWMAAPRTTVEVAVVKCWEELTGTTRS